MSRKWERMVRKNTSTVNATRKKSGHKPVYGAASGEETLTFKGRSWFLPMLLTATGVFCFIAFRNMAGQDQFYWITGASYIFLAVIIYLFRRPFLRIGKTSITSRRFGGDRTMDAGQISDIVLTKDAVTIGLRSKKNRWVFTRLYHQFPMNTMKNALKQFAANNAIALKEE